MQRLPTHIRSLRLSPPAQSCRFSTTQSNNASKSKASKLPSSNLHNDLASFRRYATDVNLPTDTTVYVGTTYE